MDFSFLQEVNNELEAGLRKQLGLDETWFYKDLPWIKEEFWNEFLDGVGENNIHIIAHSKRTDWSGGPYHHAQIMYNPEKIRAKRVIDGV